MQKFAIGIPTLNRADLLLPSLKMYSKDFKEKIYVIDNGNQGIESFANVQVITNKQNIGVAASWNVLCDRIFETADYALILNDDIYLRKTSLEIEMLINIKSNNLLRATPDWCAFIISKKIYNKVGRFDECFFPAYYEDSSYEYRMKLKGVTMITAPALNPFIYNNCKTMEKMPELQELGKNNKQLYIKMWGGEPKKETFKKPYNR
jgi:GT2 family glycosyltransferase